MRYEVYDEEGKLFRKFWDRADAERFLQPGWKLVTKAKHKEPKPTAATHGSKHQQRTPVTRTWTQINNPIHMSD